MEKNQTTHRMFGLAAALIVGSLALVGCTSTAEPAPADEPGEAQQVQPEMQPDEEVLYGVTMPRIKAGMDADEKQQTELSRLRVLSKATNTRGYVKKRLGEIWTVADPSTFVRGQSPLTAGQSAERAIDMTFKTVEGRCLAEKLSEEDLAGYTASVESSAKMRFEDEWPETDLPVQSKMYWLHRGYSDLPHDEALQKTDALYQAIEDSGCLAIESPERHLLPEMVPDWQD